MKRRVTLGRDVGDGILISVRVRPRSRPGIAVEEGAAVVSVASPPIEGKATEEARRALGAVLGVAPSLVTLRSGERSRSKVFHVAGVAVDQARRRLEAIQAPGGG